MTQVAPCGDKGVTDKREGRDNLKEDDDDQPISGLSDNDVDTVIQRWRDVAEPAGAVEIRRVTAPRKALIASAIAENGLSDVLAAIDRIAKSKWAMGGGERGWQATLKWVLAPGKPAEILDGEHDDFRSTGSRERDDGFDRAINRRINGRNADSGEGGDGLVTALYRRLREREAREAEHGDGFTRALHRALADCVGEEADCESIAEYADFSEVDDEAAPWP